MEKEKLQVKIIPVIKKKWITKLVVWNQLFTSTVVPTKIAFKVIARGNTMPDELSLTLLRLKNDTDKYYLTFNEKLSISGLKNNKGETTKSIKIVIPSAGVYFIDVFVTTIPDEYMIETIQLTFEGKEGKGQPQDDQRNRVCRTIIGAVDSISVKLSIMNSLLILLTIILIFLTFKLIA